MFRGYKRSARDRRIEFKLTRDEFLKMAIDNCHYCGSPPSTTSGKKFNSTFTHNGIDRVDSSTGYTSKNVVTCCERCNFMKRSLHKTDFIDHIKKIHDHPFK